MTIEDFWTLIAHVDRALLKKGEEYDEAAIGPLVQALAALEKEDLQSFQDHLARVLYDLDGRKYFDACIDAAGSDDSFLYVRCFVVAMGQDTYKSTLSATPAECPKQPKNGASRCSTRRNQLGNRRLEKTWTSRRR
jgi:hypothetical protein